MVHQLAQRTTGLGATGVLSVNAVQRVRQKVEDGAQQPDNGRNGRVGGGSVTRGEELPVVHTQQKAIADGEEEAHGGEHIGGHPHGHHLDGEIPEGVHNIVAQWAGVLRVVLLFWEGEKETFWVN